MANYNLTQTGAQVQAILNTVAAGYIYMGTANLTTTPDTTNPNVCYLLTAVGTYTNFGNIAHLSGIGLALWNGTVWSYQNVPSSAVIQTDTTPTDNSTNPIQSGWFWTEENGTLLYSRSSGSVTTAVNYQFDITSYDVGTIFRVKIDNISDYAGTIFALTDGSVNLARVRSAQLATGQVYYFVKRTTNAKKIRFYKSAVQAGHIWDFSIYSVNKLPGGADISSDYTYSENNSVQFLNPSHYMPKTTGDGVIGEYVRQGYWSASELQYNRGISFKVAYDSSTYQLSVVYNYYNSNYFVSVDIATGSTIDTSQYQVWSLCIRHKTYANIDDDAINTLVTYSEITGIKYDKGAEVSIVKDMVENKMNNALTNSTYYSLNIAEKPFVHHCDVEVENPYIPSQSLMDIHLAKLLGAKYIEANTHKCSDGVYVCKHGNNGALGAGLTFASGSGLSSTTQFSAVTSTSLRQNVTYASTSAKYGNLHIPTLDEFCSACASEGIGVLLQIVDGGELAIARKYLLDQNIIAYNLATRGDFKGTIMMYGNADTDTILSNAATKGKPFAYSKSNLSSMSDSEIATLSKAMHENGCILGTAYAPPINWKKYHSLGVDFNAASYKECNSFNVGSVANIVNDSQGLTLSSGATFDSSAKTFSMASNSTIKLINSSGVSLFATSINIRYSGTLTIMIGTESDSTYNGYIELESDGMENIALSGYEYGSSTIVYIRATAQTTIYDLAISVSGIL